MKRFLLLTTCFLTLGIYPDFIGTLHFTPLYSALRVGADVETGGVSYSNPSYVKISTQTNSYMYEKTRIYLEGDLKQNVTVGVRILSRGIFGKEPGTKYTTIKSSVTFINYTPQIENAFIEFSEIKGLPVDVTLGRQPIKIGQGIIVDDDGLGFDAARISGYLPFDINADAFLIKKYELALDSYTMETDSQMYAVGANWVYEKDYNFRAYYFVEQSSSPLKKNFISLRADGAFKQGVDYRAEMIKSGGDYSGISYMIGMTAYSKLKRLGNSSVNFEYAVGSGKGNGLGFAPTYGHKMDGFEKSGYGEYFGASMTDFLGGDERMKSVGGQGVHTTTLGLGIEPYKDLNINFDYFVLFSLDHPQLSDPGSYLGEEIDFTLKYKYNQNCTLKFIYGRFSPLNLLKSPTETAKITASKIGWAVQAKF